MNLFASLELGRKALQATRLALDVAGNNIANVNTPGYTRRRVDLQESGPVPVGNFFVGNGVVASRVSRVVDGLLHAQIRSASTSVGRDDATSQGLDQVEALLGESTGGGISASLSEFWSAFSRLSASPEDAAVRREAASRADALAGVIRDRAAGLTQFRRDTDRAVTATVAQVAQLSAEIGDLNRRIQLQEPGQGEASEARDLRSEKLRQLAGLVDIQVADGKSGAVYVSLAGTGDALVTEEHVSAPTITRDSDGLARIQVTRGGATVDLTDRLRGGKLGGLLVVRDDRAGRYAGDLDTLAADLVARVNTVHRAGFDATGVAGGDLFVPTAVGASAAETLQVSAAILADPRKLAAGGAANPGDGSNALAMAALERQSSGALGGRTATGFLADLQTGLGLDTRSARSAIETSRAALQAADERMQAISGVDLDEEAAALLQYQRSYEAAARFIAVIDEMTKSFLETVVP